MGAPVACLCERCSNVFVRVRRRGSFTVCNACRDAARIKAWKLANPERTRALNRAWAARNPDKNRASKAASDKRNRVGVAAKTLRWQHRNRERVRQIQARTLAKNAERIRDRKALRRHRQRAPMWADRSAIAAFYQIARRVTRCTGIRFEVDHIVPLNGERVSGLHVPENLRVLPKIENVRKLNRFEAA